MRRLVLLALAIVSFGCAPGTAETPPTVGAGDASATADLTVRITGLRSLDGQVGVSLFTASKGFPDDWTEAEDHVLQPIDGKEMTVVFSDLQPGEYAVAVLHDEDGDGELGKNMLGIPNEGYGVSNDATNTFGPPAFEDARFQLSGSAEIVVPMHY